MGCDYILKGNCEYRKKHSEQELLDKMRLASYVDMNIDPNATITKTVMGLNMSRCHITMRTCLVVAQRLHVLNAEIQSFGQLIL